ncbi:6-hydroxynicotinate 3-monooxygenase [Caballeronia temeraria]|uniref:6-hydroxynicotinate 3-monooxygenase n=1 Tax=Caballeronia temeraria TaxID=1777137 RepID=A0A158AT66_9BURK|nr:FAD-dependent monooxygenase [Caballeronia temeraria]SAK60939.1 6-hydroxynicotinate 3-monooxygenase [Caballeronia temeraria]
MTRNVLISGAGVAGLAAAFWLDRAGFDVTLVERSDGFRRGGQAIDIRGVALDVMRAMGLLDDARALRTQLKGMSMLDADGNEIHRTEERTYSAGRLDSTDIEIFRDDLCELLMNALSANVEFVYGDSIRAIDPREDSVRVAFAGGADRSFDLLIGADGIYSNVRKHVFDAEAAVVFPLGVVLALFSTPNFIGLDDWQIGHRVEEFGYVIYPSRDKRELRIGAGFAAPEPPLSRADVEAQKRVVSEACAHLKGDFPRFIDAMRRTDQFYYNELAQIHMPSWSKGHVVLLGDAAHCASPFSGQGTSLALVGAFVLAHELVRNGQDFAQAFAAYENRMRPYVDLNQALVDPERQGPVPDEQLDAAKNGIDLTDLLTEPIGER